jgi:hypothetical protein
MRASLGPLKSIKPILTLGYELRPCLIKMIQNNYSFSGEDDENPYSHLEEFLQISAWLRIAGMSDNTLRWKLFPFSLMGIAKRRYDRNI